MLLVRKYSFYFLLDGRVIKLIWKVFFLLIFVLYNTWINGNAYKVDLPGEYGVGVTFNVFDLTLFDVGNDSRSNPFEERGDDADQPNTKRNHANDPLEVPIGPITRASSNKLK